MKVYCLSLLFVLTYIINIVNAAQFKVICSPNDYGGSGVSVNIDGESYDMKSENNDILYEYTYDGTPTNYYYEVNGAKGQDELSLFGSPRIWNEKNKSTLYEVYGRRHTIGDDLIKTIPRLYPALEGYEKYSLLFQEGEIPVINVHMKPEDYKHLISLTQNSDVKYTIDFDLYTPYEKRTFTDATIKLSGQGSRLQEKKPYKIDLAEEDPEKPNKKNTTINNRKEFKLRNIRYDPSGIRNKLAGDIAESLGLPITQAAPCRLYINNKSYGLYEIADMYKKKFVRRYFNPEKDSDNVYHYGSLYKGISGEYPALFYSDVGDGSIKDLYETIVKPTEGYDPYKDLLDMIKWAENLPENASIDDIEKQFDIDMFMKSAILEYIICQWDGYIYNGNNFFTYIEPNNGKYHFFSYDFDSTFGKWCEAKTGTFEDFVAHTKDTGSQSYGPNEPRRDPLLYTKVIKNPNVKPLFEKMIKDITENLFNLEALGPRVDYFHEFIKDDLYWDVISYKSIETKFFGGEDEQPIPSYEEIEAQFDVNANENNLKSYIDFKSKDLAKVYGVKELKADNRFGTVGGKIISIEKENKNKKQTEGSILSSENDNESSGITKYSVSSFITILSILFLWIMN